MKYFIPFLVCIMLASIAGPVWCTDSPPAATPAATAADFKQDAAKASAAGVAQAAATEKGRPTDWLGEAAKALTVALTVAGLVAKFAPATGWIANVLQAGRNGLWWLTTPKAELDYEDRQAALARGMEATVKVIQTVPGLSTLKDKLAKRLPADTLDHVNAMIAELEDKGVDTPVQLSAGVAVLEPDKS